MKNRKEPNFYYVYIITNLILNKQYVGSRMCYKKDIHNDEYMGSSKYLKEDIKIYRKENFIKKILDIHYTNKIDMLDGETFNILKYNTLAPNGYNRYLPNTNPGFHAGGSKHSLKSIEKMSESHKGLKHSEETIKLFKETRKGINNGMYGKGYLIAGNNNGMHKYPDCIKGEKNGMYNKHHSEKSKTKMSISQKNRKKIKCYHCNREFDSSNYTRWHGNNCKLKN